MGGRVVGVAETDRSILALAHGPASATRVEMFYGGSFHPAASGKVFQTVEPATGAILAEVADGDRDDLEAALEHASRAASIWGGWAPRERGDAVAALGRRIIERANEIGLIDARDTGSPLTAMRHDAQKGGRALLTFAGLGSELKGSTYPLPGLHYTRLEAYGVVARIIAFNHPGLYACSRLAPALMAGNAVILKPSELASLAPLAIAELSCGILPDGLLSVLTGGPALGAAIAAHPAIQRLSFTGGVTTALRIQAAAATSGHMKNLTFELGGKNPIVVFGDADLPAAARGVVRGMNFTRVQGQSCGSTSRLLVHASAHRELLDRIVDAVAGIRIGDPTDEATEMGALINQAAQARCLGFIQRAIAAGGEVRHGGRAPDDLDPGGAFLLPTVIDNIASGSELATDEVFGPILAVSTWTDEAEAIREANNVRYGLTASVWTRDLDRAIDVAHRLEAGYVWVNDVETRFPGVPFGGWKDSGMGLEHGIEEMYSFARVKAVNVTIGGRPRSDAASS
jgi:acyl-CoA reductase-like NAD-dependent aldehyde dehydrogenase